MTQYDERFWRAGGGSGLVVADLPFRIAWDATDSVESDAGIMTTFTTGAEGDAFARVPARRRIRDVQGQIARVFPAADGRAVRASTMAWPNERYTGGGYAAYQPGQITKFWEVLRQPMGRIRFAGEHTEALAGYMESAVRSGHRVAAAIGARARSSPARLRILPPRLGARRAKVYDPHLLYCFNGVYDAGVREMKVRGAKIGVSAVVLSTLLVGVSGVASAGATPSRKQAKALPAAELAIVAYSTPQAAYEGIIPAFQKTAVGKNITFTQSYGASGDQSRAVAAGQPADIVEFSLEPDVTRLVDAGIVSPSWNKNKYKGFVTNSVAVIVTRQGDPKKLKTWGSLTKSGIEVITPNPATSGSARWNVMARLRRDLERRPEERRGRHLPQQAVQERPGAARQRHAALQTFAGGKGDALHLLRERGDLRQPERPVALVHDPEQDDPHPEPGRGEREVVRTRSRRRRSSSSCTRRPRRRSSRRTATARSSPGVVKANKFPTPKGLFTIDDLGGWPAVTDKFFDPDTGIVTQIERNNGVATSK